MFLAPRSLCWLSWLDVVLRLARLCSLLGVRCVAVLACRRLALGGFRSSLGVRCVAVVADNRFMFGGSCSSLSVRCVAGVAGRRFALGGLCSSLSTLCVDVVAGRRFAQVGLAPRSALIVQLRSCRGWPSLIQLSFLALRALRRARQTPGAICFAILDPRFGNGRQRMSDIAVCRTNGHQVKSTRAFVRRFQMDQLDFGRKIKHSNLLPIWVDFPPKWVDVVKMLGAYGRRGSDDFSGNR